MEKIVTTNPTSPGILSALGLAAAIAAASFRWLLFTRYTMAIGMTFCFAIFILSFICLAAVLSVKTYIFDGQKRNIVVDGYLLRFIHVSRAIYRFEEVTGISLRTGESCAVVIFLTSGKELYPKTGNIRQVRELCKKLEEIMGRPDSRRWS